MVSEREQLHYTLNICSALSIASSFVICLKYYYFPSLRSRSAKLVVWLSLSNIGLCISIMAGADQHTLDGVETKIFAFLINYFLLSNLFWSAAITKTMAMVILQRNKLLSLLSQQTVNTRTMQTKRMLQFHVVILVFSLLLSLIPIFTKSYTAFDNYWYWYGTGDEDQGLAAVCYYFPLLIGNYMYLAAFNCSLGIILFVVQGYLTMLIY
jgi:hypothetical protein